MGDTGVIKMNLHPLTLVLLLALSYLFYAEGQFFFLFTTLAIGFLLLVTSLSGTEPEHSYNRSGSLYPEQMKITILGPPPLAPEGKELVGEGIGNVIDFGGKLFGKFLSGKKLDDPDRIGGSEGRQDSADRRNRGGD